MKRKREFPISCRMCGCTEERSCGIVTKRGVRSCQWEQADLCDNPACLVRAAQMLEKPQADLAKASRLRERADAIRNGVLV